VTVRSSFSAKSSVQPEPTTSVGSSGRRTSAQRSQFATKEDIFGRTVILPTVLLSLTECSWSHRKTRLQMTCYMYHEVLNWAHILSPLLPRVWPGHPSSPLVHLLPHLFPLFYFSLSFIGFSSFVHPFLSTRIVPLCFQAGGHRRRPNLGLVCVLWCNLCYLYSLVKTDCVFLFYLV